MVRLAVITHNAQILLPAMPTVIMWFNVFLLVGFETTKPLALPLLYATDEDGGKHTHCSAHTHTI